MRKILLIAVVLLCKATFAQNVGIGTTTPDASAQLDISSATKGMLAPRLTLIQRNAIANPAKGLLVFVLEDSSFHINAGTALLPNWQKILNGLSGWTTKGNAGTTATNFIGTTDVQSLRFKLNNLPAGILDIANNNTALGNHSFINNTTGEINTAVGDSSLKSNTIGNFNTAIGFSSLKKNTEGFGNTAIGGNSLLSNTTGGDNTALGSNSLYQNNTGIGNTVVGSDVMSFNTIGEFNTAMGFGSLYSNNAGSYNVAIGYRAAELSSVGNDNVAVGNFALRRTGNRSNLVAIGDNALRNNGDFATDPIEATANTAVGSKALMENTLGFSNTAIGNNTLKNNTTGAKNTAIGDSSLKSNTTAYNNTAIGFSALKKNTEGGGNTAVGVGSLFSNITGGDNTALGSNSLYQNSTGIGNTVVGSDVMSFNTIGEFNTAMGFGSLYSNNAGSYNVAIGYRAAELSTVGNNNVAVGNFALRRTGNRSNLVAIGDNALRNNGDFATTPIEATANTAVGSKALMENTLGRSNTAIGNNNLRNNTVGNFNTALGDSALRSNITGNRNTAIGMFADVLSNNLANATAIGYNAKVGASNSLVLGGTGLDAVNVGIGTTTPNAYGHGGTNRIVEIQNDATAGNSQAQLMLTTASITGSIGGINWASKNITAPDQRAAFIGTLFEAASTPAAPKAAVTFYTTNSGAFAEKMRITSAGNIGIGTASPAALLHLNNANSSLRIEGPALAASGGAAISVGGNGDIVVDKPGTIGGRFIVKESGNVGIGTAAPTERLQVVGNILASGTITPSDFRYKENILDIANSLQKVKQLRGVTYNLRTTEFSEMQFDTKEQIGLIAQEVEKVMPNVVHTGGNGYKGVEYEKIVPLLIEGMKEQQKQIDELKLLVQKLLNK